MTTPVPEQIRVSGIWIVCSSAFSVETSNGFVSVNREVVRNSRGEGCPASRATFRVDGPRSAGFLPDWVGFAPVIGLYGGGIITSWPGFDVRFVAHVRELINSAITTTCWVESPPPLILTRGSDGTFSGARDTEVNASNSGGGLSGLLGSRRWV